MNRIIARNIGGVSVILIVVRGAAVLSTIILANILSKTDFGEFALLRTLILLIPPLAIWGQDIATARFFSHNDASFFQWTRAFRNVMRIALPLILVGAIVAYLVYQLQQVYLLLIIISGVGYCIILLLSNLLRSQKRYHTAIILDSGFRLVFFFIIISALVLGVINKYIAIGGYALCFPAFAIVGICYVYKKIPSGNKPVPRQMHLDGLWLMLIDASVIIMASVDSLFIPGMLTIEALAIYQAVIVPVHVFDILGRATKYVLLPEFGAQKQVEFRLYNIAVAVVAIFLLSLFVFGGLIILHILYGTKFDEGLSVLRIFALVGVLRLFYSLGSSMIVGRLGQIALKYHLVITVCAVIIHVGMTYWLLLWFGLFGAALAVLLTTLLRVAGSYFVVHRFRYTENETIAIEQPIEPNIDVAQA